MSKYLTNPIPNWRSDRVVTPLGMGTLVETNEVEIEGTRYPIKDIEGACLTRYLALSTVALGQVENGVGGSRLLNRVYVFIRLSGETMSEGHDVASSYFLTKNQMNNMLYQAKLPYNQSVRFFDLITGKMCGENQNRELEGVQALDTWLGYLADCQAYNYEGPDGLDAAALKHFEALATKAKIAHGLRVMSLVDYDRRQLAAIQVVGEQGVVFRHIYADLGSSP